MWISRLGDGRWRSDRADGPEFQVNAVLMVSSEAICVSMCCRDCQHNILFLGSGQISLPEEHRGGDSGFGPQSSAAAGFGRETGWKRIRRASERRRRERTSGSVPPLEDNLRSSSPITKAESKHFAPILEQTPPSPVPRSHAEPPYSTCQPRSYHRVIGFGIKCFLKMRRGSKPC